jgi:nucleoside-diphosphate kinase
VENAKAEIALWFKPEEIIDWKRSIDEWVFE